MLLKLASVSLNSFYFINIFSILEPLTMKLLLKNYIIYKNSVLTKTFLRAYSKKNDKNIFDSLKNKVCRVEQTDTQTNTHSILYK